MSLFFETMGASGAAFRMRNLSERLFLHLGSYLKQHGFELEPSWLPIIICLESGESKSVGALAIEIGYSHVAIVKLVRAMQAADWLEVFVDPGDRRKKMVSLSNKALDRLDEFLKLMDDYDLILQKWIRDTPDIPNDFKRLVSPKK